MKTRKTARKLAKKQPQQKKKQRVSIPSSIETQGEFEAEERLAEDYFTADWQPRKSKGADEEL